jgi:hypothetical protein
MEKIRKVRDFYTLDPELYKKFLEHIEAKNLDKSKLLETLVKEYMEKLDNL